jgi:hypothetical protein
MSFLENIKDAIEFANYGYSKKDHDRILKRHCVDMIVWHMREVVNKVNDFLEEEGLSNIKIDGYDFLNLPLKIKGEK